jgi:hypothetical protein
MGNGQLPAASSQAAALAYSIIFLPPNGQTLLAVVAECFEKFHNLIKARFAPLRASAFFRWKRIHIFFTSNRVGFGLLTKRGKPYIFSAPPTGEYEL